MKKKLVPILILSLLCTGCGKSKSDTQIKTDNSYSYEAGVTANDYDEDYGYGYDDDYYYSHQGAGDTDYSVSETEVGVAGGSAGANAPEPTNDVNATLNKEMLVYSGGLDIDTLDFDTSVRDFKSLINSKGGFVENETYQDNSPKSGNYAVNPDEKYHVYTATVRVPSSEYEAVMEASGGLGDLRNKYSNATNVTQKYGTYKAQLEVYEAEYNRYLALLAEATEDEYALMIENELFDIQLQIATLKSNITNIENDVAYSYIDVKIREVSKYEEAPAKTDTFGDRFKNTCKESWEGFLGVLEDLLFFIITNIYYLVLIAIIIIVAIIIIKKAIRKYKANNADVTNQVAAPVMTNQPAAPVMTNVQTAPDSTTEDNK